MDKKTKIIIISVGALLVIGLAVMFFLYLSKSSDFEEERNLSEQKDLQIEQLQLSNEYDQLSAEFMQYEGQRQLFTNDSILAKYEEAQNRVEELREELRRQENLSKERIAALQEEIASLKNLLRHYVERINELQQENESLREDNQQLTQQNQDLNRRVTQTANENEVLSQRMELAEKLNVSRVSLTALNAKGKVEKKVTKAKQLAVTFTIPQNNSTPVGTKTIYLRITSPEGNLLRGNGITFTFEGATLDATAKKNVEYEGNEIPDVTIYWDNNAALNPGAYLVELFADNYRLSSSKIELK